MMAQPSITPPEIPETPPPRQYPTADYDFTLQTVMELQKTVGQLTERINVLIGRVDSQDKTLTSISRNIYAGWIVLVIFLTAGGFLIDKLWPGISKLLVRVLQDSSTSTP
jgi:hypothetical protein